MVLANLARMNIPPSEANGIDLAEYEALIFNWNEGSGDGEIGAPDPEIAMRILDLANSDPRLTH